MCEQRRFSKTDESHLAREKARADAEYYSRQKQAEGYRLLLSKEYLELKRIEAIATNNKVYYGSNIPSFFLNSGDFTASASTTTSSTKETKTSRP